MTPPFSTRLTLTWQLCRRAIPLGERTLIMGIVNITPDSFSDGGSYFHAENAVVHALQLLDEGADILDLGAESTRPGSHAGAASAVSAAEEQARLLPVVEGILCARPDAILSVDTYKAATARAALAAGVEIINDVSGFLWDSSMVQLCSEEKCGIILMHTRGRPDEWVAQAPLAPVEVLPAVEAGLKTILEHARSAGISPESIVLDPGYGFGKRGTENFSLIAQQQELLTLGHPLLAGLSRKSFLAHALSRIYGEAPIPADSRETASLAAAVAAVLHGASILRVHNVSSTREAVQIADAILQSNG